MALIRRPRDGALLVSEESNPEGDVFHRPLGGHVEFGEYAADTLHREFGEEIGQQITDLRLAGVLQNIFSWGGATEHEIVFVFTAGFADPAAYEVHEQPILDARIPAKVIWRSQAADRPPFYPEGVAELALASQA
jgi:ADP-ribose pyrophosphatase YjhB (NUDIX family)